MDPSNSDRVEGMLAGIILAPFALLQDHILYCRRSNRCCLEQCSSPRSPRWFLAFLGAIVAMCVAFLALLHISLYAYFHDIVTAGHAQSPVMRLSLLSQGFLTECSYGFTSLSSASFFAVGHKSRGASQGFCGSPPVACDWIDRSDFALAPFREYSPGWRRRRPDDSLRQLFSLNFSGARAAIASLQERFQCALDLLRFVVAACPGALALDSCSRSGSCGYAMPGISSSALILKLRGEYTRQTCEIFMFRPIQRNTAYWTAAKFPEKLNDGIDLLRTNLQRGDRVTTLANTDPFSFALGIPPANDGLLSWDLNMLIQPKSLPYGTGSFWGMQHWLWFRGLPMEGTGCCFETPDMMLELYGGYLHSHFQEIASTDAWILYRRATE